MTNASPTVSNPPSVRFDNSPLAVALVAVVLAGVVGTIFFMWSTVKPTSAFANERYLPIVQGAALTYRMTNADGSVTYRSRNIVRTGANSSVALLDVNSFTALMQATDIDLDKIGAAAALEKLAALEFIEVRDTESDAQGVRKSETRLRSVLLDNQVQQFSVNEIGINPPIPLLPTSETPQAMEGKLNESVPFQYTQAIDLRGSHVTALGELPDCIRVRSELTVNSSKTQSRTWYCAGIGEVADETTDANGTRRTEIVSASVGNYIRGNSPIVSGAQVNAALKQVFEDPLQGTLIRLLDYKEPTDSQGISTAILPADSLLLYGTQSGALVALDRAGEKEAWRFQTGNAIFSTPIVANGIAYFGSADKRAYAVRLSDGAFVWAYPTADIVSVSPAYHDGTVFFASEDRNVYALDADTGRLRWQFSAGHPMVASPVIADGLIFVSNNDGGLYALNELTGAPVWSFAAGNAITAPVVIEDGILYFGSYDQNVYALDEKSGNTIWSRTLNDYIKEPVIVARGRVYVRLPEELFALDRGTGTILWRYDNNQIFYGAPLLFGDQLWILMRNQILELDADTGQVTTGVPTTATSAYAGVSSNGRELYVGFFDGELMGFVGATK